MRPSALAAWKTTAAELEAIAARIQARGEDWIAAV